MSRFLLPALLLSGCDDVGLDPLTVGLIGPALEVAPEGDIAFGGTAYDGGVATETLELLSTGDEGVVILDVFFEEETPLAFSIGDALPLPMMLPPGEAFPVTLSFAPDAIGSYNGWVMITIESEDGPRLLSRRLIGQGCDPEYADGDCS